MNDLLVKASKTYYKQKMYYPHLVEGITWTDFVRNYVVSKLIENILTKELNGDKVKV